MKMIVGLQRRYTEIQMVIYFMVAEDMISWLESYNRHNQKDKIDVTKLMDWIYSQPMGK